MLSFSLNISTKFFFGYKSINNLSAIFKELNTKKVLVIIGKESAKRNGSYKDAIDELERAKQKYIVFSDVKTNTWVDEVRKAINISKGYKVEIILAIGGGSVIDCAKWIAAGSVSTEDVWCLAENPEKIVKALPVIAVSTMSASGSETDTFAVIFNPRKKRKIGISSEVLRPYAAILDPQYTYSVSKYNTGCGIADIISHVIENIFVNSSKNMFARYMGAAIIRTCIDSGRILSNDLRNYNARSDIMWAGNWAINGFLDAGQQGGWSLHPIEHYLGCYYGITHGEGMAILLPHWFEFLSSKGKIEHIINIARDVFLLDDSNKEFLVEAVITNISTFYKLLGLPTSLRELGIDNSFFEEIACKVQDELKSTYIEMTCEDIVEFLYFSL